MTPEEKLKRNRAEHVRLVAALSPDSRDAYEERAAILQFQCGMSRDRAEAEALRIVCERRSNR